MAASTGSREKSQRLTVVEPFPAAEQFELSSPALLNSPHRYRSIIRRPQIPLPGLVRACPGHPRLRITCFRDQKDAGGRDKPGRGEGVEWGLSPLDDPVAEG